MLMKLPGTNQYIDKYKYERQDTPHTIPIIFMRINKRETYVQHYLRASHVRYILIYLESALNSYWSCGLILSLHPPPTGQDGRYFADAILKMHFREWKMCFFDYNFTEICSQWSNWQQPSICLDNGLVPNRRPIWITVWDNPDLNLFCVFFNQRSIPVALIC